MSQPKRFYPEEHETMDLPEAKGTYVLIASVEQIKRPENARTNFA